MNILLTPQNVHPVLLVDSFATTQVSFLITFAHSFLWSQQNFNCTIIQSHPDVCLLPASRKRKTTSLWAACSRNRTGVFHASSVQHIRRDGKWYHCSIQTPRLTPIHQERVTLQYSDELASLSVILFTSSLCCHGSQRLTLKTWLRATWGHPHRARNSWRPCPSCRAINSISPPSPLISLKIKTNSAHVLLSNSGDGTFKCPTLDLILTAIWPMPVQNTFSVQCIIHTHKFSCIDTLVHGRRACARIFAPTRRRSDATAVRRRSDGGPTAARRRTDVFSAVGNAPLGHHIL